MCPSCSSSVNTINSVKARLKNAHCTHPKLRNEKLRTWYIISSLTRLRSPASHVVCRTVDRRASRAREPSPAARAGGSRLSRVSPRPPPAAHVPRGPACGRCRGCWGTPRVWGPRRAAPTARDRRSFVNFNISSKITVTDTEYSTIACAARLKAEPPGRTTNSVHATETSLP